MFRITAYSALHKSQHLQAGGPQRGVCGMQRMERNVWQATCGAWHARVKTGKQQPANHITRPATRGEAAQAVAYTTTTRLAGHSAACAVCNVWNATYGTQRAARVTQESVDAIGRPRRRPAAAMHRPLQAAAGAKGVVALTDATAHQ